MVAFFENSLLNDVLTDIFRLEEIRTTNGTTLAYWLQENIKFFTTNGQLKPVLDMDVGEMYRFR